MFFDFVPMCRISPNELTSGKMYHEVEQHRAEPTEKGVL